MIHRSDLIRVLESRNGRAALISIYGDDPATLAVQRERWSRLAALFAGQYPEQQQIRLFSTPGRTEVGGNHTDHQSGRVLCASVDLDIIALAAPNQDDVIRLKSEGFPGMDIVDLRQLDPVREEREHSASLIRGIAAGMRNRGHAIGGLDIYTTSRVPKGSGLSSSAAFEILVATMIDSLYNENSLSPVERALIAQEAENQYFGKPCGLMDQCGCSVGGFIAIDFAITGQPQVDQVHFDFAHSGHALIITNTGGSHADLTDDYASVPRDMSAVAAACGHQVLRQVSEDDFWERLPHLRGTVDDQAILRAIHFFADNERVLRQKEALQQDRFADFLEEVSASGRSSWTCLQNVYSATFPREQPVAVGLALSDRILAGRGACRVHGGGFAGTIQAYVPHDLVDTYLETMSAVFGQEACSLMQIRQIGSTELQVD